MVKRIAERAKKGYGTYSMSKSKGSFTLPGESGYEDLTLRLAEKWGADVIRDSDGTQLSSEIVEAGYGIYSTICLIRGHNEWAKAHRDKLQQTFLMTTPRMAVSEQLRVGLLDDFFEEQFAINDSDASLNYWQVFDRTTNKEVPAGQWVYHPERKEVEIKTIEPWHRYSVSFLAYRIWEEISMYNHVTNHWDKEHLLPIDPRYKETQEYLLDWMENWCREHPHTTVVRFTSLFYNFVWIWGSDVERRNLFTDWASYDFTVSPEALDEFAEKYGYRLTAEDFINQGKLHVTHMPADQKKRDYMEFINDFVIDFGKRLIEIVHKFHKQAYVFYDDSWIGIEPYGKRFPEFGFDGIIKAVFNGFEARLCGGVNVATHELRLHPYLFPTGVDGSPSFLEGGNPTEEAGRYWVNIRRALLRQKVDRIGFGGYLHLVESKPDFEDYVEKLAQEFRKIKELHDSGEPYCFGVRIAVLHYWGSLRSWTCSGHFHETYMLDLIHINESLSGLSYKVSFIDFEDIKKGVLKDVDVVINAGFAGSAWSGGECFEDEEVIEKLTEWVYKGGSFIGVGEPSAVQGYDTCFAMAHVLGVDKDPGERICHGKWPVKVEADTGLIPEDIEIEATDHIYLTDKATKVYCAKGQTPMVTVHAFGKGYGVYLSGYHYTAANTRMLVNLIQHTSGKPVEKYYLSDNIFVECAYFPGQNKLAVINNSPQVQKASVSLPDALREVTLQPCEMIVLEL